MLIFGTGVVTGGLLVRHSDRIRPIRTQRSTTVHPAPQPPGGGLRLEFLRRVQRELDLTPEQRARADAVLKEGQERTRKVMEPISPRLREELQRTKAEFRALLTPEQQAKFDALLKHAPRPRPQTNAPALHPQTNAPAAPQPATP